MEFYIAAIVASIGLYKVPWL